MMLMTILALAGAQTTPTDRHETLTYPAQFEALRRSLSKAKVDEMMASAVTYCRSLPPAQTDPKYGCTLYQASDILQVDSDLGSFSGYDPHKLPDRRIAVCWRGYNAQRLKNVHPLASCLHQVVKAAEELQARQDRATLTAPSRAHPTRSSYCDSVFRASGRSYVVLEECEKQEAAAKGRLSR